MRTTWIRIAAPLALGSLGLWFAPQKSPDSPGSPGAPEAPKLERVFPKHLSEPAPAESMTPQDAEQWRIRLIDSDLDRREADFDRMIEIARRDPEALTLLRDWAADPRDPELAWTARLALREAERTSARSPLEGLLEIMPEMRGGELILDRHLGSFLEELRDLHGLPGQRGQGNVVLLDQGHWGNLGVGEGADSSKSIQIEVSPEGARCVIREQVDGEEQLSEYEAGSVEELLEAHPELSEHLKVEPAGGIGEWFEPLLGGSKNRWVFEWDPLEKNSARFTRGMRTDILGVYLRTLTPEESEAFGLSEGEGMYVQRTLPGTIASTLGVQRGHVLLELNGKPVDDRDQIGAILCDRADDEEVTVLIVDGWGQQRKKVWRPK